jgi:hypothetical protein
MGLYGNFGTGGSPLRMTKSFATIQLRMVTDSWFAVAWGHGMAWSFGLLSILSINPGNWLYPVGMGEAGERVDSKKSQ